MGLLSSSRHYHSHDNSTNIKFPDTIKVHEHKAPTDESIRIMEEMHDKAIKNIIAKVSVDDNVVKGKAYCIEQPWCLDDLKLVFKFKINGHEFNIEKNVNRSLVIGNDGINVAHIADKLNNYSKAIMLWYALKSLTAELYEDITNSKFPQELLK